MKDSTAMFLVVTGIVLAMLGLGGVEASMDSVQLAQGILVALAGIGAMAAGALAMNVNRNTDYYK